MVTYSDNTLTITADNSHFQTAQEIHVTFRQNYRMLDVTGDDIAVASDTELIVNLSQQQTAMLAPDTITKLQVNYIDEYGKRKTSDVVYIPVLENLLEMIL